MKKIMSLSLMLIAFVFNFSAEANAQSLKRIQFAKGKAAATVKGNTGSYGVAFVVRAKSGQKLVLNLTPASKVGIKVETKSADGRMILLRQERGGIYKVGLEESGDYTIFIGSIDNKPVSFALTVKIAKLADV